MAAALRDRAGKYVGPMVTWELITEKRALEARSADYAAQMEALGRTNAVVEFKPDGTIITANTNFLKATGYELNEVAGKHHRIFCDLQLAESDEYREFWAKLARGEFVSNDFQRKTKDGRAVWLRAAYNPIRDMSGKVVKVVKFVPYETEIAGSPGWRTSTS